MLDSYSRTFNVDNGVVAATIDALNDCAQACIADVDADLGEQDVLEMVKCIRLCMECADICAATVTVTSRLAEYDSKITRPLLEACAVACKDRKSTRLNSSHRCISYAVFCLKKKKTTQK